MENDIAKIHYLLKVTVNEHFSYEDIKEFKIVRLGAEKNGYNRVKMVFSTAKKRDEFLKNSDKLKNINEPWSKIYLKKDQHPVYLAENNRLRRKKFDLKELPENETKEVKIVNGKLLVGGAVVDKNMFFH